ncbi:hypothetical protein [Erythrobacter sp. R86502]|uniref:hypothetical protein n=1 Tax=Erythrobacter sp. R86502 TaxID=3093846 RepID=UPI0036D22D33
MKKLLFVAFATSLVFSATVIHAQQGGIVVSSGRSVDDFVNDVSRDLDRQLKRIAITSSRQHGNGVAQVLFECGPDGKPINVRMYKKSGFWTSLEARSVVSKIRSLHPLPQGITHDQLYLANIIIADSPREFQKLSEKLEQLEKQRIASATGDRKIFAFNLSKSPST